MVPCRAHHTPMRARHRGAGCVGQKRVDVLDLRSITGHKDLRMLAGYYNPDPNELAKRVRGPGRPAPATRAAFAPHGTTHGACSTTATTTTPSCPGLAWSTTPPTLAALERVGCRAPATPTARSVGFFATRASSRVGRSPTWTSLDGRLLPQRGSPGTRSGTARQARHGTHRHTTIVGYTTGYARQRKRPIPS